MVYVTLDCRTVIVNFLENQLRGRLSIKKNRQTDPYAANKKKKKTVTLYFLTLIYSFVL